jgi:hypothetical protein
MPQTNKCQSFANWRIEHKPVDLVKKRHSLEKAASVDAFASMAFRLDDTAIARRILPEEAAVE